MPVERALMLSEDGGSDFAWLGSTIYIGRETLVKAL
jgi:hypothetical protein